jgi:hypothetical protein
MIGYFRLTPPLFVVLRKYSERSRGTDDGLDGCIPRRVAFYFYNLLLIKVYSTRLTRRLIEYREKREVEIELWPFDPDELKPVDPDELVFFDPDELEPFESGEGGLETCLTARHLPPVQLKKSVRRFWVKGVTLGRELSFSGRIASKIAKNVTDMTVVMRSFGGIGGAAV